MTTVRRFVAPSAREALRKVKEELGPDAVVVGNKAIDDGVEILAMSPASLDALARPGAGSATAPPRAASAVAQPRAATPTPSPPPATGGGSRDDEDYRVLLSSARQRLAMREPAPSVVHPWAPPRIDAPATRPASTGSVGAAAMPPPAEKSRLRPLPPRGFEPADIPNAGSVAETLHAAAREPLPSEGGVQMDRLMVEMRGIKTLLERQLAGFAWSEIAKGSPQKAQLLGELLEAGFSGLLARRLIDEMPEDALVDARKWLTAAINRRLRTLPTDADLIDRGGVYALVGPTGVGKTTTTAKLAARCVVRYGADKLALLTTDGYRIGAHEQLRIYGRILGVPVYVVRDGDDLRRTLDDLRGKHMVLIDTVGMSQRDRMVAEQAAMLARSGEVHRLLLLNAGARGDMLDDVVRAYAGEDLAGCILTKVDEAPSLAPGLDCIIRNGLTLAYVANGQRVPEDMHLPNRAYLLHRALKHSHGGTAHALQGAEIGLSIPAAAAADAVRAAGVHLG